jgi:hypothetical protein
MPRWVRCSPLTLLLGPALAWGEAHLVDPPPRLEEDILLGPCGAAPGAAVAMFEGGSTVEIQFVETVDRPGHYRLALSPEGIDGDPEIIIEDNIPDVGGQVPAGGRSYRRSITVPDRACPRCTLQLMQTSIDIPTQPTQYYSCADINITARPAPDAGPRDGGGGRDGSSGIPNNDDEVGSGPGVCSVAPPQAKTIAAGSILALVLLTILVVGCPRIGAKVPGRTGFPR